MNSQQLLKMAETYLEKLCNFTPDRCVGSEGNRAATRFFEEQLDSHGFSIETPGFDCMYWQHDGAHLSCGGRGFEAFVSPYTLGCELSGPLCVITSIAELEHCDIRDKVVLLHGEIAKEQLMPKNFVFYNPEEHQRIIRLLENKKPCAIITATTRNPELAGGVYPFPLIEDGDFDVFSVYMTREEGENLAGFEGETVQLTIRAHRTRAEGCNVIARKGNPNNKRAVICAHIDCKQGTKGAVDNAAGIIVLLLLGHLLAQYKGELLIEMVAMNGEDYYSAPGEVSYLKNSHTYLSDAILGINLDGVGYKKGKTAFSLYNCPGKIANLIHQVFQSSGELVEGDLWYQGDHGIFIQNNCPALAITTENFMEICTSITHTPKDCPEIINCEKLVQTAKALYYLFMAMDEQY